MILCLIVLAFSNS